MARRRSVLSTKTSRASLPVSDAPEWELISPGVRLGYRKGRGTRGRGGAWLAAARAPDGTRVQSRLGQADDVAGADGTAILSHEEAKERARLWAKGVAAGRRESALGLTVNVALDKYLTAREGDGMKSIVDARQRANRHIRPALGKLLVIDLTADRLSRWRDGMATTPKQLRTRRSAKEPNYQPTDFADPEVRRRRRDTANRTLTVLKAALHWARDHQLVGDDTAWRLTKPYRGTTAARVRFLDGAGQRALLGKCDGALRDLVAAALVTGARFGELARLRVRDFDPANGSVFIAESKSGKSRHVPLPPGGVKHFANLAKGKTADQFLLLQDAGAPWLPATYRRALGEAVKRAELEHITFHELRHTYASTMVRAGVLMKIVAEALGHSDTRMVEKHYGHLAPSYVADTIRRHAPDLEVA
ncbi:MAG: tyrosine-type recombinase/integrase [Devosia sp.]